MQPTRNDTRTVGLLYLSMLPVAPFALIYIPQRLIVRGNPAETASRILGSEMLFRLGIVGNVLSTIIFVLLALALYRLFQNVDRIQAVLMVALAVISTPITFFNVVNDLAALTLLRGADYLQVFSRPQLEAAALFFLGLSNKGTLIAEIFWGLWLFPFGILVMRSRFMPRILGVLLIVNGFAYVVASMTGILFPSYGPVVNRYALIPETGELWFMLWILIKGIKVEPMPLAAAATT
jgi:hypothetical protein